jgi:hypothetical protein
MMNQDEAAFFLDTIKYMVIDNKLRLAWTFDDGKAITITLVKT